MHERASDTLELELQSLSAPNMDAGTKLKALQEHRALLTESPPASWGVRVLLCCFKETGPYLVARAGFRNNSCPFALAFYVPGRDCRVRMTML